LGIKRFCITHCPTTAAKKLRQKCGNAIWMGFMKRERILFSTQQDPTTRIRDLFYKAFQEYGKDCTKTVYDDDFTFDKIFVFMMAAVMWRNPGVYRWRTGIYRQRSPFL
jgi:hypothetical protein